MAVCYLAYVLFALFALAIVLVCLRCCCCTQRRLLRDNYEIILAHPLPSQRFNGNDAMLPVPKTAPAYWLTEPTNREPSAPPSSDYV